MVVNELMVEVLHVLQRDLVARNLGGTQTTPDPTAAQSQSVSTTVPAPTPTMTNQGGGGPTSSPLLFFVALGFGVVFTNLWIIVGVKYCFRYNARNRALRNGENGEPIDLENMPARPHRRRREKKLMTMDEVNERFPLTKYKNWVAGRAREGLSTSGGVNAPASRAASLRAVSLGDADGVIPSSPVDTKHSINTRPATASSDIEPTPIPVINATDRKSMDVNATEKKDNATTTVEEQHNLEQVRTTASTVDKQPTAVSEEEDDDEDDHIHTAVAPELLDNPGDSCAICIDTLEDDDDVRGLTCGHAFHAGCLDPWLTSRRASCPLCKADYYTPKPRPEGEVAENERAGRSGRRREQANMPQHPPSAWTGIRGHPRFGAIGGRFGIVQQTPGAAESRSSRRAQRRAQANANTAQVNADGTPRDNITPATTQSRRWNPFRAIQRSRQQQAATGEAGPVASDAPTTATPSQLEAGVVR